MHVCDPCGVPWCKAGDGALGLRWSPPLGASWRGGGGGEGRRTVIFVIVPHAYTRACPLSSARDALCKLLTSV